MLKGERSSPPKFYIMDKDETLMENLSSKRIIENPVFYVIFSDSLSKYAVDRTGIFRLCSYFVCLENNYDNLIHFYLKVEFYF